MGYRTGRIGSSTSVLPNVKIADGSYGEHTGPLAQHGGRDVRA